MLRAQTGHENTSLLAAPNDTTFHLEATFRDDCEMSSSMMMGVAAAECGYQLDIRHNIVNIIITIWGD